MKAIALFFLLLAPMFGAGVIVGTGNWSTTLTSADLTGGAGTNLTSTFQSASNAISLDLSGTPTSIFYHVFAHYTGVSWPGALSIAVKRTSNGTSLLGGALISGGTSYTTLGTTDIEIFNGFLDRTGVTIQVQVTGVSVAMTPASYLANIVFTITP